MTIKTYNNIEIISKLVIWLSVAMFATTCFPQNLQSSFNVANGKAGMHCINSFPFNEGFEKSSDVLFQFNRKYFSYVYLDKKAANKGEKGLIFQGSNETSTWIEPSSFQNSGIADYNIWDANLPNIASASVTVDAIKIPSLILRFDLKQIYEKYPEHSVFRLLVNGAEVRDIIGNIESKPANNKDAFTLKTYDLSKFTGRKFTLTFESCCKSANDCVLIDNISLAGPDIVNLMNK